jgi:hypothetical protein
MSEAICCAMMLLDLLVRLATTVVFVMLTLSGIAVVGRLLASGNTTSLVVVGLLAATALWMTFRRPCKQL